MMKDITNLKGIEKQIKEGRPAVIILLIGSVIILIYSLWVDKVEIYLLAILLTIFLFTMSILGWIDVRYWDLKYYLVKNQKQTRRRRK